jgi:hypothetical protein
VADREATIGFGTVQDLVPRIEGKRLDGPDDKGREGEPPTLRLTGEPNEELRSWIVVEVKVDPKSGEIDPEDEEAVTIRHARELRSSTPAVGRHPLATVYLLSPEDTPAGAKPGPDWTPYVKHRVFWNLVHAVRSDPPVGRTENITIFTGLAGGVADGLINQLLATNNDASAAASEFLANRTVEGRFWTV